MPDQAIERRENAIDLAVASAVFNVIVTLQKNGHSLSDASSREIQYTLRDILTRNVYTLTQRKGDIKAA